MLLLSILIFLFILVVGMIVYANWPDYSSGTSCGASCDGCNTCKPSRPPCGQCGQSKRSCRCPKKDGCQFC